ncbi:MAG: TRAP-type mannitol/chloroaromatic compound transport system permease small subunit [Alphaproteobacteria bacterium]|jgi:TRAP-type mannitol/chloroaromatic compound transport system permease small subunit
MLANLSKTIDKTNAFIGKAVAYCTLLMAVIMCAVVIFRYGFDLGWIAMQESITYLHAAVFLLGSAYTYQQDGHVRVDVFYRRYSVKVKHIVDLFGCLLLMLPVATYIAITCWPYVMQSWQLLEGSREPGGLPFVYVLKSFMLIFAIMMILQAVSEIIKHSTSLLTMRKVQ